MSSPADAPRAVVLTTPRLELVPCTFAEVRAVLDGSDVGRPLAAGYPHADTPDAFGGYVASVEASAGGALGLAPWFMTLREDGRVFGDCGTLGWVDDDGRVEIGYGLAAPFRGQGYGTEAVRALADWVAEQDDVHAVTAEVEIGNDVSRKLLLRLGFFLDGEREGHWLLSRAARPPR